MNKNTSTIKEGKAAFLMYAHPEDRDMLSGALDELLKSEIALAVREARKRRENELLIMMHECEKKGWDFDRFIRTFAALLDNQSTV